MLDLGGCAWASNQTPRAVRISAIAAALLCGGSSHLHCKVTYTGKRERDNESEREECMYEGGRAARSKELTRLFANFSCATVSTFKIRGREPRDFLPHILLGKRGISALFRASIDIPKEYLVRGRDEKK
jgi:hypothetical protein